MSPVIKNGFKLKALKIKIIIAILLTILIVLIFYKIQTPQNEIKPNVQINKKEFKQDSIDVVDAGKKHNNRKLNDTIVILKFKDLSNIYNYQIIDKYYCTENKNYYDSVLRIIKIFNKNDSLLQKIYPTMRIIPWYFNDKENGSRLSRSFITGKNKNYNDLDNYCGEIVIADLNFDGLEDMATPIDCGADNGPHYAYYIQRKNHKFDFNKYLTENLIWFPETINDSLLTLTNAVPCTVLGINYQTFKYDSIQKKWRKIEDYLIDINTGKLMK